MCVCVCNGILSALSCSQNVSLINLGMHEKAFGCSVCPGSFVSVKIVLEPIAVRER